MYEQIIYYMKIVIKHEVVFFNNINAYFITRILCMCTNITVFTVST